jgi:methionyl-tRNA synthetase
MAKNKFYITTPIYYVNDIPHVGHAYTTIAADVLARYHKSIGDEVFFLTGTDEHGAKIAEAAATSGKNPQEFVDGLVPKFKNAWDALNIKYDQFIRTTDAKHEAVVLNFVKKLTENGYITKRKYTGLYCVGCEKFYTEGELENGKCPHHQKECVTHSEENYFFLLKKATEDFELEKKIKNGDIEVAPEARKNEVLGKIKTGLEDVSISRESVQWGIKFPNDDTQTIYVWVDALINYYTATKIYPGGPEWPASLHLMAKDILWFHAIIWPAMLLAAGEKAPKKVFAHGFFTVDGKKMSKSVGNVLDPIVLAHKYGADAVRYSLLREFPFGEDGDISEKKIALRYENELANGIGNLLNRTLSMINKYEVQVSNKSEDVFGTSVTEKLEALNFMDALETIRRMVDTVNEQIEEGKPWQLARDNKTGALTELLDNVYWVLGCIGKNIAPFMPETAEKIKDQLKTLKPEPIFPRIED